MKRCALEDVPWLEIVASGPVPPEISAWKLDPGEEAVVTWAWTHPGAVAILDDFAGRSCAESLGINVRGTVGIILIAKQRGMIAAARPLVEELRRDGMYLSDAVVQRALAIIGE